MPKVRLATYESARPIGTGPIESRAYFDGPKDALHLTVHRLGHSATLSMERLPTDAMAYVWKGAAGVAGTRLAERSSMIVGQGASIAIAALDGPATILLFSLREPAGPDGDRAVHLLPNERVPRNPDLGGQGTTGGALHADASEAACHLWMHENDFYAGGQEVAVHSHSEDEIIFVRDGAIRLGNRLYGPGAALAIAAGTKYGFHVGPDGLSFVNFRAASPTYATADGSHSMDEGAFWRAETGVPHHLVLSENAAI